LHHARHDTGVPGFVADLDELIPQVDILSLHVPGGEATHHLIDARRLALLSPDAILVNTARGTVVDEPALARALHDNQLFAAGLDVYEHEPQVHPQLLTAPRTVLLPHIGSATQSTRQAMVQLATSAIAQHFNNQPPESLIPPP
ncbi:MAG: NAD(P)-dependent oxidoreductase, partial [Myxococcota bacterium]|nr:NAD(P)-dependent oxidoreductase [Myxococcota bacterium]